MASRRIRDRLAHMLEAIDAVERLTSGKTLDSYSADPDLAAAVGTRSAA